MEKVAFITTEREHLFDLTRRMMAGIELDFLRYPQSPVVVSVCGSIRSGKSILPDAACEYFWGKSPEMEGREDYNESYTKKYKAINLQIDFINAAWKSGYSDSLLCHYDEDVIVANFLEARRFGGVSFVHNTSYFSENEAGVDIWIEDEKSRMVHQFDFPRIRGDVLLAFNNAVKAERTDCNEEWGRYIEIKVRDERLCNSPKFQYFLRSISFNEADNGIPVYGVNIPRPLPPSR